MVSKTSAISVNNLVVGFGKRTVLDHLSLDVRYGEILGVVGASGGGKSVLLRSIIGLISKRKAAFRFSASTSIVRHLKQFTPSDGDAAYFSNRVPYFHP